MNPIVEGAFTQVDEALAYADEEPFYGATDEKMKELAPKLKQLFENINEIQSYYSCGRSILQRIRNHLYSKGYRNVKSAAAPILEVLETQNAELDSVSIGGASISRGFGYLEYFDRVLSSLITAFNKLISAGN